MSYTNPTSIRLGMTGTFFGVNYRVVGRGVLGMDDAGGTYYWNEFYLRSDDGQETTLVFEQTENGDEWRLFTLFEPDFPITAEDAATKRVGDGLNFDGTDVRVTLIDESRVYYLEGSAPEGEEVGDVARYFNAEGGNRLVVVSWTGNEVECFRGEDLSYEAVASAFGLPIEAPVRSAFGAGGGVESFTANTGLAKAIAAVAVVVVIGSLLLWLRPKPQRQVVQRVSAPELPIKVRASVTLQDRVYTVQSHAVVEIAEQGRCYEEHECQLVGMDGESRLLIYGFKPGLRSWFLFRTFALLKPLRPVEAAAVKTGQVVQLDSRLPTVRELFQATRKSIRSRAYPQLEQGGQTDTNQPGDFRSASVLYGFIAEEGSTPFLVRWDAREIIVYIGSAITSAEAAKIFEKK